MEWRSLLFMHWPVDVSVLRPLIPEQFEIDVFDGRAWLGLVPFTMRDVTPVFCPRLPLSGITDFHECNVRTYLTYRGEPGVYFFSLDAASRIGVWAARRFYHLPYFYSHMTLQRNGDTVHYGVDRMKASAQLRCVWRVGEPLPQSQPGELTYFLTERYALFTVDRQSRSCRLRIWHDPWPLRDAELLECEDSLVRAAGIEIGDDEPLLHHAELLKVRAWGLEHV